MDIIAVNKFKLKKRYLILFIIFVLIIKDNLTKDLWMKDENIRDVSSQTKELVEALELYKSENNLYPESLKNLVPKYINEIPTINNSYFSKGIYYGKIKKGTEPGFNYYSLIIDKDEFVMLGDRQWSALEYNSHQIYRNTEYNVLHKVVDGWAAYTNYRNYNPDLSSNSQVTSENRKVENN